MEEQTANSHKIPSKDPNDSKELESEDMTSPPKISGSCACGSVKWSSSHSPSRASFCYCKTCRKLSGGAFLAFMDFPASSITILPPSPPPSSSQSTSSTLKLMALTPNAERGFCLACGSTMTMRYRATWETLYLTIASVDGEGLKGLEGMSWKHLYVGEIVDWYRLPDDGLPRFETMPNEGRYLVLGD